MEDGTVSKGQRAIGQGSLIMNSGKGFQFPTMNCGQDSGIATNDFAMHWNLFRCIVMNS